MLRGVDCGTWSKPSSAVMDRGSQGRLGAFGGGGFSSKELSYTCKRVAVFVSWLTSGILRGCRSAAWLRAWSDDQSVGWVCEPRAFGGLSPVGCQWGCALAVLARPCGWPWGMPCGSPPAGRCFGQAKAMICKRVSMMSMDAPPTSQSFVDWVRRSCLAAVAHARCYRPSSSSVVMACRFADALTWSQKARTQTERGCSQGEVTGTVSHSSHHTCGTGHRPIRDTPGGPPATSAEPQP